MNGFDDRGYEVGYGKPPKHTQFKKGQSGNKKGRPKGSTGLRTDLKAALKKQASVQVNGELIKGTRQQVQFETLTLRSMTGDVRATKLVTDLTKEVIGVEDEGKAKERLNPAEQAALDVLISDGWLDVLRGFQREMAISESTPETSGVAKDPEGNSVPVHQLDLDGN